VHGIGACHVTSCTREVISLKFRGMEKKYVWLSYLSLMFMFMFRRMEKKYVWLSYLSLMFRGMGMMQPIQIPT
jgi:hypothetical protein